MIILNFKFHAMVVSKNFWYLLKLLLILNCLIMPGVTWPQSIEKRTSLIVEIIMAIQDAKEKIDFIKKETKREAENRDINPKKFKIKTIEDLITKYEWLTDKLQSAPSFENEFLNKKIITVNEINCPEKQKSINQAEELGKELDKINWEIFDYKQKLFGIINNLPLMINAVKDVQVVFAKYSTLPIISETFGLLTYDAIKLEQAIKKFRDAAEVRIRGVKREESALKIKRSNLESNIDLIKRMQCVFTFISPYNTSAEIEYSAHDGCRWIGKFFNIKVSVTVDLVSNIVLGSDISATFSETKKNACGYATIPENPHYYGLASKADGAIFMTLDYLHGVKNLPKCSARFIGQIFKDNIKGQLILTRTDVLHEPLASFKLVKEITLFK